MSITFVVWLHFHRRSEILAQHLGATIHYVQYGQSGKWLHAPIRYAVQAVRTWHLLVRQRPGVVFVQNPPIFVVLIVYLYARRYGAQFVIDSHTGAFLSPQWRLFLPLHRALSRRALLTIVHNQAQELVVAGWGCRRCVIAFTPGDYPTAEPFPFDGRFNIAVINTFSPDEPLGILLEAANRLGEVDFYVTGNPSRMPAALLAKKASNVHLTGYLPYAQYISLLRGANAVLDLTLRDHTLLMGAFEAVSLGTPLITSDWPILREYFSLGTIHVPNSVDGVCAGICQAQHEQPALREGMHQLQDRLVMEWNRKFAELQAVLATASPQSLRE